MSHAATSTTAAAAPDKVRDGGYATERLCSQCGEWWPDDGDFFAPRAQRTKRGSGVDSWCRACRADYTRQRRAVPTKGNMS